MISTSNRKLRRLRQNQILVCMSLSLLSAILLFSFGINGVTHSGSLDLCKAMALLLHYFLLSSIVWMSIEAYNLYQDLVKVFDTTFISQNEFMCRAGVVGWSKSTLFFYFQSKCFTSIILFTLILNNAILVWSIEELVVGYC